MTSSTSRRPRLPRRPTGITEPRLPSRESKLARLQSQIASCLTTRGR
jgi:hypothetical protein